MLRDADPNFFRPFLVFCEQQPDLRTTLRRHTAVGRMRLAYMYDEIWVENGTTERVLERNGSTQLWVGRSGPLLGSVIAYWRLLPLPRPHITFQHFRVPPELIPELARARLQ